MHLLFKSVDQKQLGIIQVIGRWMEVAIGYVPDTHIDIADYSHLKPRVLSESVAWAWMFVGAHRDYISVRSGTPQNQRLQVLSSHEADGDKTHYTLTDDDKTNTTTLMKEIMRLKLDEIYDKRLIQLDLGVSDLEFGSWSQQRAEATAYATGETNLPLLQSLATARGITLEEMVTKVNNAVIAYNQNISNLLSAKQAVESDIKQCNSISDCNRLLHNRFEIEMPLAQKESEGITTGATFNI